MLRKPGEGAIGALVGYAAAPDPHVRRIAIECIGKHRDGRSRAATICAALNDPNEYVVRTACEAIATLRLQDAHAKLLSLLTVRSAATRCSALRALRVVWQPDAHATIVRLFLNDPAPEVRKEAAWVLHAHITPGNRQQLLDLWCTGELPRYRSWACELCARLGATEPLEELAKDRDGHVRSAARRALHQLHEDAAHGGL